jgi:hypothetical protein
MDAEGVSHIFSVRPRSLATPSPPESLTGARAGD